MVIGIHKNLPCGTKVVITTIIMITNKLTIFQRKYWQCTNTKGNLPNVSKHLQMNKNETHQKPNF